MASINAITGTLGFKNAAHLLKRSTFGPTRSEILQFQDYTASEALDALLTTIENPLPPVDPLTGTDWLPAPDESNSGDQELFSFFKAWFMELMRTTGTNLRERMVYFYHTHLPVDYNLVPEATALYYQNTLYRYYALGNFKTMFAKMCVDNAMLLYIDNTRNISDEPNENFAREMLELYSIGKGPQIGPEDYTNYTETDVQQAARVLTGIKHDFTFTTIDTVTGIPRGKVTLNVDNQAYQHDTGTKTFTSKFQNTSISPNPALMIGEFATEEGFFDEINQMMDMIFDQEETAKFICRKLYRFFVYRKITDEVEQDIIAPLASTFINNGYEIVPVLRQLLMSEHFYDVNNTLASENNIGALIKSPLDISVGLLRYFKIDMPTTDIDALYNYVYGTNILKMLDDQGMSFFTPIDVAGYPPYHQEPTYHRNWISPNWLANRYVFISKLISGFQDDNQDIIAQLNVTDFVKDTSNISAPSNAATLVSELIDSLFPPVDIPVERINYFTNTVFLAGADPSFWTTEWNAYIGGGSDTTVKTYLERLIVGLCQSPEFQLF